MKFVDQVVLFSEWYCEIAAPIMLAKKHRRLSQSFGVQGVGRVQYIAWVFSCEEKYVNYTKSFDDERIQ
ncbi:unnamed protein product [Rhizophagus irregularis]|nr:unnamed protein product [Rhizophagus irregularis]CAB5372501.1 unnamed protein product [Rhizophagus irregularis]